jgi:hypothetical protein
LRVTIGSTIVSDCDEWLALSLSFDPLDEALDDELAVLVDDWSVAFDWLCDLLWLIGRQFGGHLCLFDVFEYLDGVGDSYLDDADCPFDDGGYFDDCPFDDGYFDEGAFDDWYFDDGAFDDGYLDDGCGDGYLDDGCGDEYLLEFPFDWYFDDGVADDGYLDDGGGEGYFDDGIVDVGDEDDVDG